MTIEDVTSGRAYQTLQVGPLDASLPARSSTMQVSYSTDFIESKAPYGTPAWWMGRMLADLAKRQPAMQTWEDYYNGNQPLAFASSRFRESFGGRFKAFSSNFMAMVVDGTRERMEVTGLSMPSQRATKSAWRMWQHNSMDSLSISAHTEALIKSVAYIMVEPQPFGGVPRLTTESPTDAIVALDPRDPRVRLAGLKRWREDDGTTVVYLYMPDVVYRLRSADKAEAGADPQWVLEYDLPNPLGEVPLVPLVNRPRLNGIGQSEVDAVMSNQDAVNKLRADALVAAEFAAFRQRWATGLDIPIDPNTGMPVEPFKAAVDRLWVVPPPDPDDPPDMPEARFGEFSATDLAPYQHMIEHEIGAIASISRIPYHYLLGQPEAVPPSGESLKSSEAGLIRKVKTQQVHFGESWEEVARLAALATGDRTTYGNRTNGTEWRDPETRNEGARTDATVKAYESGIIERDEARLALGYSPAQAGTAPEPAAPPEPAAAE